MEAVAVLPFLKKTMISLFLDLPARFKRLGKLWIAPTFKIELILFNFHVCFDSEKSYLAFLFARHGQPIVSPDEARR